MTTFWFKVLTMKIRIILTMLLTQLLAGETTSRHYHIVPVNSTHLCQHYQAGSCLTLDQLSSRLNETGDITLSFLPGDHLLTWDLNISGANNVTFSNENHSLSPPRITCLEDMGISINHTSLFTMQGLMISGCRTIKKTSPFWVSKTRAARIYNCIFTNNSANTNDPVTNSAGGALGVDTSVMNITNTSFVGNSAVAGGAIYVSDSQLTITTCFIINNTAEKGAGIFLDHLWYIVNETKL